MARMLVVDDDLQIRLLLARIGERCGFEVDTARDGIEAMELLETTAYAIALVDLMMPRFSGYEILEKLHDKPGRPKFLVVTAMADEYIARITPDFADAIVRKPFDLTVLTSIIQSMTNPIEPKASEAKLQSQCDGDRIEIKPDPRLPG